MDCFVTKVFLFFVISYLFHVDCFVNSAHIYSICHNECTQRPFPGLNERYYPIMPLCEG